MSDTFHALLTIASSSVTASLRLSERTVGFVFVCLSVRLCVFTCVAACVPLSIYVNNVDLFIHVCVNVYNFACLRSP